MIDAVAAALRECEEAIAIYGVACQAYIRGEIEVARLLEHMNAALDSIRRYSDLRKEAGESLFSSP